MGGGSAGGMQGALEGAGAASRFWHRVTEGMGLSRELEDPARDLLPRVTPLSAGQPREEAANVSDCEWRQSVWSEGSGRESGEGAVG